MKTCYVIAREGVSGGTGTLSLRLLSELHQMGEKCAYLCCVNNAPKMMEQLQSCVDKLVCIEDRSFKTHFNVLKDDYDSFVFLTYSLDEYLKIDKLRRECNKIKRLTYYVVHGYAFKVIGIENQSRIKVWLRKTYNLISRRFLIKEMIENKSIVFMDDLSVEETSRSLRLKIDKSLICHIPIRIFDYKNDEWRHLKRHTPFTIGTMCRLEFPMKGYVMGLIDELPILLREFDIRIIIVGDGEGGEFLRNKISMLPDSVKSRITYIRNVPYNEIGSFFARCDLFLGMGTTLLDASQYNVLAVPVEGYSYNLKVGNLFLENVEWLCCKGKTRMLKELLLDLFNYNNDEYNKLVKKQYDNVKADYNMDVFINRVFCGEFGIINKVGIGRTVYCLSKKVISSLKGSYYGICKS